MTPVLWAGLGPPGRTPLGPKANEDYSSDTNRLLVLEHLSKIARIFPTQGPKNNLRKFSYTLLGCSKAHQQYQKECRYKTETAAIFAKRHSLMHRNHKLHWDLQLLLNNSTALCTLFHKGTQCKNRACIDCAPKMAVYTFLLYTCYNQAITN